LYIPLSVLPEKFVVAEDRISSLSLGEAEGEIKTNLDFETFEQEVKVDQFNLSAIVHGYFTSDMKMEYVFSVFNKAVKLSPADFEKIKTKHTWR